jgi:hypothetical protein
MASWKKLILAHYGMNWMSRPHFISHHWKQFPAIVPTLPTTRRVPAYGRAKSTGIATALRPDTFSSRPTYANKRADNPAEPHASMRCSPRTKAACIEEIAHIQEFDIRTVIRIRAGVAGQLWRGCFRGAYGQRSK